MKDLELATETTWYRNPDKDRVTSYSWTIFKISLTRNPAEFIDLELLVEQGTLYLQSYQIKLPSCGTMNGAILIRTVKNLQKKNNGNNVGINKYETVTRSSENKNERTSIKQTNVEGEMKRAKEQTNEGKKG